MYENAFNAIEKDLRIEEGIAKAKAKARAGEIDVEPYQPDLEQSGQPGLFEGGRGTQ